MAVNFCLGNYKPHISCSQVSADGYSIQNLISPNPTLKRKGFHVEYFIKPPVDVLLVFPVPLEIHSITLGLQVGNQQVSAVEIWTSCSSDQDEYQKIGFVGNTTLAKVTFVNRRYNPRKFFSSLSMPQFREKTFPLSAHWRNHLKDVGRLKLKINRTIGSTVPCLSELSVWAQPSYNCPKQDLQWILKTALCKEKDDDTISESNLDATTINKSKVEHEILDDMHYIPEEFLDPITFSIMSLPVLLPSGHTIDQSTLDKFTESEASWGRCPSDLFTGVVFKKNSHPVPNAALKTRIDKFIIDNQGNRYVKDVGRTVGRNNTQTSRVNVSLLAANSTSTARNNLKELESQTVIPSKRIKIEETNHDTSNVDSVGQSEKPHESQVSESLDNALKALLGETRSYKSSSLAIGQTSTSREKICTICTRSLVTQFYLLPCSHLACRPCLLNCKNACLNCQAEFSSKDVQRAHL